MDLRYGLYDQVTFGVTANTETILFQTISGGDATHGEQITNMRGPGQLPSTEQFVVDKISVVMNDKPNKTDINAMFIGAILEVRVADFTVLKMPMAKFIDTSAYGGSVSVAVATDVIGLGLDGDGYELDKTILLKGSTAFKVRILQGAALSATQRLYVILQGIYTMAGQS